MAQNTGDKMSLPRMKISRWVRTKVNYRGQDRNIIVEIDRESGNISIRLHGCKTRRTYHAADLYQPVSPQLSLPL